MVVPPPFTIDDFLSHLSAYNTYMGKPFHAFLITTSLATVILPLVVQYQAALPSYSLAREYHTPTWHVHANRLMGVLVSIPWFCMSMIYFMHHFSILVSPIASAAALLSLVHAIALVVLPWIGSATPQGTPSTVLSWTTKTGLSSYTTWIGVAVALYAIVGYPLVSAFDGRSFPECATIGTPLPTALLFLGLTMIGDGGGVPIFLHFVPYALTFVWSFGILKFGLIEDYPLFLVALLAFVVHAATQPVVGRARPETVEATERARRRVARLEAELASTRGKPGKPKFG